MPGFFRNQINYLRNRYARGITIQAAPVFITGCGHSGTSLLLSILGTHSRIFPIPYESKLGYKGLKSTLYLRRFNRLAIAHGKTRWVEKTPKHIHCLEQLLSIQPGVKIIIIIRDGRDVACSFKDRFGDLERGIKTWVTDNSAGRPYWKHPAIMVIRYEDIVSGFEATIKKVLHFIGEDFEPALLEYYKEPKYFYSETIEKPSSITGKDHNQYRNWQINQPLFNDRGKWTTLAPDEKTLLKNIGNDLLLELGYVTDRNW